jgi:hypothetical protein
MSKRYLLLTGLVLLGVSGLALARSAASDPRQDQTGANANQAPVDPLTTPAGIRWLQGQPTHWRAVLLRHD